MGASPIIAPPQPALSPAAKKTRRPTINRSPAIPKIPQNPAEILLQTIPQNPANPFRQSGMHPSPKILSFQSALDSLSLIRDTKRMEVLYTELFDK